MKGRSNFEVDANIIKVLKELGATSKESAVSAETIIKRAIDLGLAESFPRDGFDGHPWYPRLSIMVGIGTAEAVARHNNKHLFRAKGFGTIHDGSSRQVYLYWYDSKHFRKDPIKEYAPKVRKAKTETAEPTKKLDPKAVDKLLNEVYGEGNVPSKKSPAKKSPVTIEVAIVVVIDEPSEEDIRDAMSCATASLYNADWVKRHPTKISKYVKVTR